MITVKDVTKRFGKVTALNDINFNVSDNIVTGFLGPNGAGKTTTMRLLTSYIKPDSGEIRIKDINPVKESVKSRRIIGYLPENMSLYSEMRVCEYLKYRAKLKGLKKKELKNRLDKVADTCRISNITNKIISHLSKGYIQRVGLADVLLTDPEILILDEPTSGLDPKQIIEFRKLVTDLKKNHTIVLSTHILSEVEEVCSEVIIIDNGKILVHDSVENLKKLMTGKNEFNITIKMPDTADKKIVEDGIKNIEGISEFKPVYHDDNIYKYNFFTEDDYVIDEVFNLVADNKCTIRELYKSGTSLEKIFMKLTGAI